MSPFRILLPAFGLVGSVSFFPFHEVQARDDVALARDAEKGSGSQEDGVTVLIQDAWVRPGVKGLNSAVFFRISLPAGKSEDVLLEASAQDARRVELHTHIRDTRGVYQMRKIPYLAIKGSATLQPGGDHVMLIDLKKNLEEGGCLPLTLDFEKAGKLNLDVPVASKGPVQMLDQSVTR